MKSNHSRQPRAAGDSGQQDNMQNREEDTEIAFGRHPQLDIRHALKSALYLRHAREKTNRQQNSHVRRPHRNKIAYRNYDRRSDKQLLVCEAELHPKQHRKPHRHACQTGIKEHQQFFQLQRRRPAYRFHRAEINPARKLDADHLRNINPRLDAFGHPRPEHRHRERRCRSIGNWRLVIGDLSHKRNPGASFR